MENKHIVNIENYDKALVKNGSVLGLLDQLIELDGTKPYLKISPDNEIKSYFGKKGISNVTNKKELESFYNHLENKIAELSDSSDERVKLYFEKREYLKQLNELPSNLSKLEQTVSSGFEGLKVPFNAVMNYVWEAVINQGFEMEERINIHRNDEKKFLCKNIKQVYLDIGGINQENYGTGFNLFKFRRSNNLGIELQYLLGCSIQHDGKKYPLLTIDKTIDEIKRFLSHDSNLNKDNLNVFRYQMKTILNLPKIMNNYVKWKQEDFEKMFKEIKNPQELEI